MVLATKSFSLPWMPLKHLTARVMCDFIYFYGRPCVVASGRRRRGSILHSRQGIEVSHIEMLPWHKKNSCNSLAERKIIERFQFLKQSNSLNQDE